MGPLKEHLQTLSPSPLPEVSENYDHIELTEEEIELALRQAREQKHYLLKRIEYRDKVAQLDVYPKYTAEQLQFAYGKDHDFDNDNSDVVRQLTYYLTGDKRFTGSHDKGIMLYGAVGVGKTELMKFFFKNQKQSYIVVPCRQIEVAYATAGDEGIGDYCMTRRAKSSNSDPFGHQEIGFCFDDLGTEPVVTKYYGTDKSVMTEVILNRYDQGIPFTQTHVTTNLSAEQIRERYGSRAADRMREMFNFIEYKSTKSRRANQ